MAEVKKPVAVAKKAEDKKVETVKKAAPVKKAATTAKKPATTKTAAKKAETKEVVFVQFDDREVELAGLIERAKEAYKAAGKNDEAKDVKVYVNVAEKMVYYVVNDFAGSFEA